MAAESVDAYGDAFGVNRAQICVFEQGDQVRFAGFLQRADRGRLEAKIGLEVLGDFTHQPLKGQLSNE